MVGAVRGQGMGSGSPLLSSLTGKMERNGEMVKWREYRLWDNMRKGFELSTAVDRTHSEVNHLFTCSIS